MEKAFLASVPLFAALSVQERDALSENLVLSDFTRGDVLFQQGEQAQAMFLIKSGQVDLTSRQQHGEPLLVTCGPKTLLGEVDLLLNQPYQSTAIVNGSVEAWILTRDSLATMMMAWPKMNFKFSSVLGQAISNITDSSYALENNIDTQRVKIDKIDLSNFPLFANLTLEEKGDVAQKMEVRHLASNELIFRRGSFSDAFYLLKRGEVRLINEHGHIDLVRPGGFFGEISLLTGQPRQVSAQAIENSELLILDRSPFEMVVSQYASVSFVLSRTLSARLARANSRIRPKQAPPMSYVPTAEARRNETKPARRSKFWKRVIFALVLLPLMWLAGVVAPTMLLNNTINDPLLPNNPPQIEVTPTVSPTPTPDSTSLWGPTRYCRANVVPIT